MSASEQKASEASAVGGATDSEEKNPDQIREEIEDTREELGDTVAAVAAKTDVKAQAQAKVDDVKTQAAAKADETKAKAQTLAKQNPRPLAIAGALIAASILWRLLRR
jgi:hypothetical protein